MAFQYNNYSLNISFQDHDLITEYSYIFQQTGVSQNTNIKSIRLKSLVDNTATYTITYEDNTTVDIIKEL